MWPKRKPSSPANVRRSGRTSPLRTSACRCAATSPDLAGGGQIGRRRPTRRPAPSTAARWSTSRSSGLEQVEPRGEHRLDGRRARAATSTASRACSGRRARRSTPSSTSIASISSTKSGFPPAARRIASAASGVERAGEVPDEHARLARPSGASRIAAPPPHAGRISGSSVPREAADENRRVPAPAGDVLDEVEERRLAPLDVVEHEHDRPLPGERLEQAPHRPVDLLAPRAAARRGRPPRASGRGRRRRPPRRSSSARRGRAGATISTSGQYVIPLPYGRQRPSSTQRRARRSVDQLGREPRLADAGLAEDRDDAAAALGDGAARAPRAGGRARASRPTSGASSRRARDRRPARRAAASRHRRRLPLQRRAAPAPRRRPRRGRAGSSRRRPGSRPAPPPSSRWATTTASPVAKACPAPGRRP